MRGRHRDCYEQENQSKKGSAAITPQKRQRFYFPPRRRINGDGQLELDFAPGRVQACARARLNGQAAIAPASIGRADPGRSDLAIARIHAAADADPWLLDSVA